MNKKKLSITILILSIIAIVFVGTFRACTKSKNNEQDTIVKEIPVKAMKIEKTNLFKSLKLTGNIIGKEVVKVFPPVTGKIHTIKVRQGQRVGYKQTLFLIDRDIIGMEYKLARVESPISGFVAQITVDRGMSVSQSTPIAEIVNQSTVECVVQIMEEDINKIKIGTLSNIKVSSFPDKTFTGYVYKKSPVLNQTSRTQEVRIRLNNKGILLRHGMFADVNMITNTFKNVIAVPEDAIFLDKNQNQCVFIIRDKSAVKTEIKTAQTVNGMVIITDGLLEGDIIVTLGHENVTDGDKLLIYMENEKSEEE